MKFRRLILPLMVALLALLLSACGTATTMQNFPGLVVQDETLYLSEGLHVYAINTTSGQEVRLGDQPLRFPKETNGELNLFAPVALTADGQMILPNSHPSQHSLFSIDPQTGSVRWTFDKSKGTWIAGALALESGIYAPGGDGILYALDLRGNQLWSVTLSSYGLLTRPISDGRLIFLPNMDGEIYALDPATGTQAWKQELGAPVIAVLTLDETGSLYVGTLSGEFYALEAASGKILWKQQLEGSIWGAAALEQGSLYVGTMVGHEGRLYALQAENGTIRWQRPEAGAIIASPLVFDGKVVYVTETGRVQALSTDGSPLWQADLKGKLVSAPVLAGSTILIAPLHGDYLVVAFDVNGAQRWTFKP